MLSLRFAFGVDWNDTSLCDAVLNIDKMGNKAAVEAIIALAQSEDMKSCSLKSMELLSNQALASRVYAALAEAELTYGHKSVFAVVEEEGKVRLAGIVDAKESIKKADKVARSVSGVKNIDNQIKIISRDQNTYDQLLIKISKRGNAGLRYGLYQAALIASYHNSFLRRLYNRMLDGRMAEKGIKTKMRIQLSAKEDKESWIAFMRYLKQRGLTGVELFVSDKCLGLVESLADFYPEAKWQRCVVHFYRNVFTVVPKSKVKDVAAMLKAIHAQEDLEAVEEKVVVVVRKLKKMKLSQAATIVDKGAAETLSYYAFPSQHWRSLRTNNPLERLMREIRRRTRVVGAFPDGKSALMLVAARLRYVAASKWGTRRYMNMGRLKEHERSIA